MPIPKFVEFSKNYCKRILLGERPQIKGKGCYCCYAIDGKLIGIPSNI